MQASWEKSQRRDNLEIYRTWLWTKTFGLFILDKKGLTEDMINLPLHNILLQRGKGSSFSGMRSYRLNYSKGHLGKILGKYFWRQEYSCTGKCVLGNMEYWGKELRWSYLFNFVGMFDYVLSVLTWNHV